MIENNVGTPVAYWYFDEASGEPTESVSAITTTRHGGTAWAAECRE